jgi:hypothetical protein
MPPFNVTSRDGNRQKALPGILLLAALLLSTRRTKLMEESGQNNQPLDENSVALSLHSFEIVSLPVEVSA